MSDTNPHPKRVSTLRGFWYLFALPTQSSAAKFCKVFVAVQVVIFVLDLLAPDVGVSYFARAHLLEMADSLADALVFYLALIFVRERDDARARVATLTGKSR